MKVYVVWIDGDIVGVSSSAEAAKDYLINDYKCPGEWHEAPSVVPPVTKYEFCEQGMHSVEEYEVDTLA